MLCLAVAGWRFQADLMTQRTVIIGSGIIGLTHAITAREAGWEVVLVSGPVELSAPHGCTT